MKRTQQILFVAMTSALGLTLAVGTAQAQITSTGANSGIVDLTLTGTVQSAIILTVTGQGGTTVTPGVVGNPSSATVNFGTFNTQTGFITPANGSFYRNGTGAYLVASLTAGASVTGGSGTASIDLTLTSGALGTRMNKGAPANWTATPALSVALTAAAVSLCPNGLVTPAGDCANGTAYAHDLGVYVPDTLVNGTVFSQVVRYTATLN